ncbi:hypothetical protein CGCSCA5_v002836 [Colletotrichum siamense]|nr:hypothetical protein CGCSCA5_v002836 [Colletotrichum siamense]
MPESHQTFKHGRTCSISEIEPVRSPSPGVTSADDPTLGVEVKEANNWLRNKVTPAMCYGFGTAGLIALGLPVLISAPAVGVAGIAAHSVTAGSAAPYAFIMFCGVAGSTIGGSIQPWLRAKSGTPEEGLWYRLIGKKSSRKAGRRGDE